VNLLDVVLLVVVAASAVHGLRLGAAIQVLSFGGFWFGLFLGALLAPRLASLTSSPVAKPTILLVVLFGMAFLFGVAGRQLGAAAWGAIRRVRLGAADAGLGAVVAVLASLLAAWLIASILVNTATPGVSQEIQGSTILQAMDRLLPPAPSVFSRIQALISSEGFPQVFAQFAPLPAGPVPLADQAEVAAAVQAAGPSTVKVEGQGCGQIQEGSGFVVAPDLVVTNAHVVAGIPQPYVFDQSGNELRAQPVLFDPAFDLAVLRTARLRAPPLSLDPSTVGRGTQAAVLGFPGGGPFTAVPAAVTEYLPDVTGRDIYGQSLTNRAVYALDALVRPGNSGGPLVEPNGEVLGVVFSKSTLDPDVGYALASPGVLARVQAAEVSRGFVGTGPCTAG
jgi:S1-C subfamily serine protease